MLRQTFLLLDNTKKGRRPPLKPRGMSCRANSPTLVSPFTVHFWVSQFGWQQWFMKRAWFPLGPASMIRSWRNKKKQNTGLHQACGLHYQSSILQSSVVYRVFVAFSLREGVGSFQEYRSHYVSTMFSASVWETNLEYKEKAWVWERDYAMPAACTITVSHGDGKPKSQLWLHFSKLHKVTTRGSMWNSKCKAD